MVPFLDLINNKLKKYLEFIIWFSYFIILLIISLFFSNSPGEYGSMFVGIESILNNKYFGDPKYLLTAALDISKNGWIGTDNDWVFNLWPPGFVIIEAALIRLFGENLPLLFLLQLIISSLFGIVCLMFFNFLKESINIYIAFLIPILIFLLPVPRFFLLGQFGISFGEPFSIAFFLLFILFAIKSLNENDTMLYSMLSGISLGLSSYFRSYFETIQLFLSISGFVLIFGIFIIILVKKIKTEKYSNFLKNLFIIICVSNLLMLPWRLYHLKYQNSMKWVFTADLMFQNQLRSSNLFLPEGEWLLLGGANTGCRVNPSICDKTDVEVKKLVVSTWINNPIKWYEIKFEIIDKYWYSEVKNWTNPSNIEDAYLYKVINTFIILLIIISIIYLIFNKYRLSINNLLLLWIYCSLILSYGVIYTFAHFEVRYFYFPKILAIYMFIILFIEYIQKKEIE